MGQKFELKRVRGMLLLSFLYSRWLMLSAKLLDVDDIRVTPRSAFDREYFLISESLIELRSLKAMRA